MKWPIRIGTCVCLPRQPRDLSFARSNDPSTWDSYERAVRRWQDGDADGIGFMLLDSGIGATDLDHCCKRNADKKTTTIDRWARTLRTEADGPMKLATQFGG